MTAFFNIYLELNYVDVFNQVRVIIFVCGPHFAFMCVSQARFQTKGEVQAKKLPSAGRMWPVGRMLPPPVLGGKVS